MMQIFKLRLVIPIIILLLLGLNSQGENSRSPTPEEAEKKLKELIPKLKKSTETRPTIQIMIGEPKLHHQTGICQMNLISMAKLGTNKITAATQRACIALTAAHCLDGKVQGKGKSSEKFQVYEKITVYTPQILNGVPITGKVLVPKELPMLANTGKIYNYPNDFALIQFDEPEKVCASAKKNNVVPIPMCPALQSYQKDFLIFTHQLGKNILAKVQNLGQATVSVESAEKPNEVIVVQGDSGGCLGVKKEGHYCCAGPFSRMRFEHSLPRGPHNGLKGSLAMYAAGVEVRKDILKAIDFLSKENREKRDLATTTQERFLASIEAEEQDMSYENTTQEVEVSSFSSSSETPSYFDKNGRHYPYSLPLGSSLSSSF